MKINHIYNADSLKKLKSFNRETINTIITDPPFGINLNKVESMYSRSKKKIINDYKEVDYKDYFKFSMTWIRQAKRVLKPDGSLIIVSGWTGLKDILVSLDKAGFTLINHIIWKYQFGVFTKKKFTTSHQHILFAVKNPKNYTFNKQVHYAEDVLNIKREYRKGTERIRTQMPIELANTLIKYFSSEGDIVLDPFVGSGTIVISAKQLKRQYIGIEISKKHYNFCYERFEKHIQK